MPENRTLRLAVLAGLASAVNAVASTSVAVAQAAETDLVQRVADLEAYVTNGAPKNLISSGPGHNAWMMTSTALVLFMTLPGLALFYGGLVRKKNVLSVLAQCGAMAGLIPIMWWAFGYSFAFSTGSPFLGNLDMAFLKGVTSLPNGAYSAWVSQNVFSMFQMMFAIITPALIVGAIAERMKFSALITFLVLWMVAIYFPMAHMVWGADGFMNGVWNANATIKAIDFAGGTVVHMTSGWSALVLCLILGPRLGFGKKPMPPHSMVLTMVGTGMLWVGWYGFNAGSAVASDGIAASAFISTTLAAAIAGAVWPALEWLMHGKPTVLGFCSGVVAGLVVVTPAAGFITPTSGVIIGVLAGVVPFFACTKLKAALKYDDALDTFGVHGVGGTLGAIVTGVFATADVNPALSTNLSGVLGGGLVIEQLKAIGVTLFLSVAGTAVIAMVVKAALGLRPSADEEELGLDARDHGESGYAEDAGGRVDVAVVAAEAVEPVPATSVVSSS